MSPDAERETMMAAIPVATAPCPVCGGESFAHTPVLWPALVADWGLAAAEAQAIDIQQGTYCVQCGSNVRSMALARALLRLRASADTLVRFVGDPTQTKLRVLEINHAGTLHPVLARLPGHRLISYPDFDMTSLALPAETFDLVVHSDTLEHVPDPLKGLQECLRVLAPGGALAFTVPAVPGRLSRSRQGLPPSYHGTADQIEPGMLVHTEFGADVWTLVLHAGFSTCELVPFHFPAGLAIVGWK